MYLDAVYTHKYESATFQLGIYNLFDQKIYMPSYRNRHTGEVESYNTGGLIREGRNFYFKIQYDI